jgi:hypothetical protein
MGMQATNPRAGSCGHVRNGWNENSPPFLAWGQRARKETSPVRDEEPGIPFVPDGTFWTLFEGPSHEWLGYVRTHGLNIVLAVSATQKFTRFCLHSLFACGPIKSVPSMDAAQVDSTPEIGHPAGRIYECN